MRYNSGLVHLNSKKLTFTAVLHIIRLPPGEAKTNSIAKCYRLKLTFSFNALGNAGRLLLSIRNVASSVISRKA